MSPKDDLTGIEEYSRNSEEPAAQASDNDLFPTTVPETPEQVDDFAPISATDEIDPSSTSQQSSAFSTVTESAATETVGEEDLPDLSQNFSSHEAPAAPTLEAEEPTIEESGATEPLEQVRRYAEQLSERRESVPAAFPFSVLIEGKLLPEEKEKLVDVLSREQMGIREVDLEPQFEGDRILIPRISEFAAVLLIQALRNVRANIQAGPSDEIFSTADTRDDARSTSRVKKGAMQSDAGHPAEALPITAGPSIPWIANYKILGVLTASASLKSTSIETETSTEYLELLESLQLELRYRAHHKGASAILNYSIQLTPLQMSSHYRVSVSGTAIKT
ncbi:MAG: hypothetical protein A2X94_07635 [Bdellovibrionales bacterium GWB1_55_8]|nr:MAG: hypothetical protein A2X94_07635 [Bdellovibrionales bacterium GWB1_55_8]